LTPTEYLLEAADGNLGDPGRNSRRRWLVALALAAAVFVALAVVTVTGDDDEIAPPATTSPPTDATTSPSTAPTTVDRATAVWPYAGSSRRYSDPVATARAFAVEFLRLDTPVVGQFQQGDSRSGEVEVRPVANGPVTTILLRQLTGEESWSVLGAATADIEVTQPDAGDLISSPARITGRARAFEGTVQVQVRQDGELEPIGSGFVTGGGDAIRPFAGEVTFSTPSASFGALVLFTESAENGRVWQAAVLRVRLLGSDGAAACGGYRSPRPSAATGQMEVQIFFNCDADGGGVSLHPVYRLVPKSPGMLRASLVALLAGPDESERQARLGSWFSAATAKMLRSATISDGHAIVDFADLRPVIPNASTSAGSERLLSQLDATVFRFASVRSAEYRIEGSCEAFTEWLQIGGCDKRSPADVFDD
jgi:hypothetical protein